MDKVTFSFDIINKNIIKIEDKNFKINNVKRELYIQDPEWNKKFIDEHILNKSVINIGDSFVIQNDIKTSSSNCVKDVLLCPHNKKYNECSHEYCNKCYRWLIGVSDKPCQCSNLRCQCNTHAISIISNIFYAICEHKIRCIHGIDLTNNFQACGYCSSETGYHVVNNNLLCKHDKKWCQTCLNNKYYSPSVFVCYNIIKNNIEIKPRTKILLPIDINVLIKHKDSTFINRIIENELKMKIVGDSKEQFNIVTNIALDLLKYKPINVYYYLELYVEDILENSVIKQLENDVIFHVKNKNIIDKLRLIEIFDPIYYKTLQKQLLLKKGITNDIKVLFKYVE